MYRRKISGLELEGDALKKISKKTLMLIIIIAAAAVVAAVCIYLFATRSKYYETHFFKGTYVNGWDISDLTLDEAKEDMQSLVEDYTITLKEKNNESETITGKQLGFKYVDDKELDKILNAQNGSEWFSHMFNSTDYDLDIEYTYDESSIKTVADALKCADTANITPSVNAYVKLDGDSFVIVPEVVGNEPNMESLYAAIKTAVDTKEESIDLEAANLYILPTVKSDDQALIDTMNANNQMLSAQITYNLAGTSWVADRDEIISWLVQNEDGSSSLSYDKVYEWVANMAYETDTFGLSRKFMTSYGVEVQLEGGGDYGWCIDKDLTTQHLYEQISVGTVAEMSPDYIFTAMDRSANDIGGTYIEVCISTQTMWCYYEGQLLVQTPIISGNVSKGYSTPSGSVWAIDAKKMDWKFTTFANAYSDYWMPFNGDVGIHDASWQSADSYVVSTYLTAGSHGCLNTPYNAVQTIYEHVEIGTPVVVYYSTDQVHGPDPTETLVAG